MEDFSIFGLIRPNYQTKMTKIQRNPRKIFSFFKNLVWGLSDLQFSAESIEKQILEVLLKFSNSQGSK